MSSSAAWIRDRLLKRARTEGADFQLFLDRYACERFLYRLGQSDLRERLILKGATPCNLKSNGYRKRSVTSKLWLPKG